MVDFDPELMTILKDAAAEHRDDIDIAVITAEKQIRACKSFKHWQAEFITRAIREGIHEARHANNDKLRRLAGDYGGPAKVGVTDALNEVAMQSYLETYVIAGCVLASIAVKDLSAFAATEQAKANGAAFNADLCRSLQRLCAKKTGETVGECVTETQIRRLFKSLRKKQDLAAA